MARIRTIKPDFWGSPKTAKVSRDARLLFLGLLNESDDEGRLLASPRKLLGAVYPHDDDVDTAAIERWVIELGRAGLVRRYRADGLAYLYLPGFTEHQKISHPTASKLPAPPESDSGEAPEVLPSGSGMSLEVLRPEGNREGEQGTGKEIAPLAQKSDPLWESVMAACSIHGEIPPSARGAYNKAVKDLRTVGASPDDVAQRAKVYRVRWPDVSLTPTALARRWAECEPNVAHLGGRTAPKSAGALARVVAERIQ